MEVIAEHMKLQTQLLQHLLTTPAIIQTLDDNKKVEK